MEHHKKTKSRVIGIDEEEESQANGIDQIFKKIREENFLKVRKGTSTQIQRAHIKETRREKKIFKTYHR